MNTRVLSESLLENRPTDPLLSTLEAASYLGLADNTLPVWRSTGRYDVPYIKVGRLVRYRKSDLDSFLARRTQGQIKGEVITTVLRPPAEIRQKHKSQANQHGSCSALPQHSDIKSYHRCRGNAADEPNSQEYSETEEKGLRGER
ncbi:DNA binding domain-containing protein, excisionase family [Nitrosospira sp. Nsp14]|uniref:helix-turn-helix domain-containing protein n=1 Tax=Nitrosospira sp. Nsp14 TaxID=1855333 RepID=UPI0008F1CD7F|nr:helix-turn-helix domain-containing protein [Nitrosospira sp. Nsp14]SFH38320.1 DNA binding domain-containing protein, excisionase family [Nitrosospira sp. Nsp14]